MMQNSPGIIVCCHLVRNRCDSSHLQLVPSSNHTTFTHTSRPLPGITCEKIHQPAPTFRVKCHYIYYESASLEARHIGPTASLEVAVLFYLRQLLTGGYYRDASFPFFAGIPPSSKF